VAPIAGQPRRPDVGFNLGGLGGGVGGGGFGAPGRAPAGAAGPPAVNGALDGSGKRSTVEEAARRLQTNSADARANRDQTLRRELETAEKSLRELAQNAKGAQAKEAVASTTRAVDELKDRYNLQIQAANEFRRGGYANTQQGTLGVNFSLNNAQLRNQAQLTQTATRWLGTRNALEVGGIWIDEAFSAENKTVAVKAQSEAYFRILERHPEARNVFRIANHLVWVTPSRTALVIDPDNGADTMSDADIDALFRAAAEKK
jgi:Ca-activated chloride channel family protein